MLRNYIKIAFRSLLASKAHSLINILGLSLGIACCILIMLFVYDEWTFDKFHSKADRIYRVYAREDWGENQQFFNTITPFPMGPALKESFPEVEKQVRFNPFKTKIKVGEEQFTESIMLAGQDLFDVFDFKLISGERNALRAQNSVVLTERMARKYFGNRDPIDKVLSIHFDDTDADFVVKAVIENIPTNSSLQFDILISDLNLNKLFEEQVLTSAWFNISPETYVLLQEGTLASDLESKFPSVFKTLLGEEEYNQSKYSPGLQPLTDIHLNTEYPVGNVPVSNPKYSYILAAIAILILVVACINFITLSVGRSLKRGKEVGIRKVVGAQRKQLITQFIGEALLVTGLSLIIGIGLAWISLSAFNELAGKQLIFQWNYFLFIVIIGLLVIIGMMAGSYPAFILSAFKPISILKGSFQVGDSKQQVRKILVGIQLVLSVFLISCTLIMQRQLNFLQNKDLGFNKDQLLVVKLNVPGGGRLTDRINRGFEQAEIFKRELMKISHVNAVGATSHDFGTGNWTSVGFTDDKGVYQNFNINVVDDEFIPTMKMSMVQGRNFGNENLSDVRRGVIINEAFAKMYGWSEAVGKRIPGKNFSDHEIIGVVKDFNYASLYTSVQPLVLVQDPSIILGGVENISITSSPLPKLVVRLEGGNILTTIDQVKAIWNKINEGEEFVFSFVDQRLDAQYSSDINLGKIVQTATLLAILIGGLGLYALASLAMQNRIKEISIRKVLGATEKSLLILLSKDYLLLVLISILISVPITWYLMRNWLNSFEYRIEIGWQIFLLAGLLSLVVAIVTISYQTIKTALTKPVDSLKYE